MKELKSVFSREELTENAVKLLKKLIATPSMSRDEYNVSLIIEGFFNEHQLTVNRFKNNIWATNKHFDAGKPSILLNTHHDTVKPNKAYTLDPFIPVEKDGKLFGLGSNDAGASLVAMVQTFLYFYEAEDLTHDLVIALTAEEEISGLDGIEALFPQLPNVELAIVGEPTKMNLAIAEKGLLVIDGEMTGTPSHAAHPNNDNAIVKCMQDLQNILTFKFPKVSDYLGEVKVTLSVINAGTQHNVVPEKCNFTLDVRVTDEYTNRSFRNHPIADEIETHAEVIPSQFFKNRCQSSVCSGGISVGQDDLRFADIFGSSNYSLHVGQVGRWRQFAFPYGGRVCLY